MREIPMHVAPLREAVPVKAESGAVAILAEPASAVVTAAERPYHGPVEFTPGDEAQTIEIAGMTPETDITIGAIPDDYVGSAIPQRDAGDLTASADTVSVPAGYYADAASATVAAGSATTPTGGITATPTISVDANGLITASVTKAESITPIIVPGYVTTGTAGTVTFSGSATQQMTKRTSADLTASGATVTAPAGYYPASASKAVSAGSATTPATTITATPSISVSGGGLITSAVSASQQVTPAVSAGYVSGGTAGTVSVSGSATEQLNTQAGTTITPTTSQQTAVAAGKYTTGDVLVSAMPNGYRGALTVVAGQTSTKRTYTLNYNSASSGYFAADTIKNGGVVELTKQTETITPDETGTTVTPTNSAHYIESVTVEPIPDDYVGSAVPQRTSSDLTASGATVSAPAGYYASAASKAVASGSEGTPTASKGAVNNHSIAVTPAVTNTAGYIAGGTHTGTAATVTASELVSGTKSITANGTGIDVTNYAAIDVAVPSGSPNLQDKTVSYTPTETAQSEAVAAGTGYDGLGTVTVQVGAISSTYVGSGITQRTSSDMSASGATVTAPAGYYANAGTKTIASGTATGPASISSSGATLSTGTGTLIMTKNVSVTPSVTAGYIASGTAGTTAITMQATATLQAATTYHPSTSDQTINASRWLSGAQTFKAVTTSNLTAANIKSGVVVKIGDSTDDDCVTSVTGTYSGGGGSVSVDTKTATVPTSTYPVSLEFTSMKGEPKMFVCRLNSQVSSSGSTTYYYIVEIAAAGTTVHGNVFRIGSTRRVDTISSGYSYSYTGTTLTITSSAASRSASPGAFYPGSYELIYVY